MTTENVNLVTIMQLLLHYMLPPPNTYTHAHAILANAHAHAYLFTMHYQPQKRKQYVRDGF